MWGQAIKTHRNKIPLLQKHALCLMYFGDYKSHAVPYFLSSRCLDFLYFKSVAVLMHDISKNLLPPNITNLLIFKVSIHSHSSSRGDLLNPQDSTNKLNPFQKSYGVKIWKSSPRETVIYPKIIISTISYSNDFQNKMTILIYLSQ